MQNLSKKDFILQYVLAARRSGRSAEIVDRLGRGVARGPDEREAEISREELVKAAAHIYELAHKEANKDA